jgi:multiple sugar transport system ATP-binding protein
MATIELRGLSKLYGNGTEGVKSLDLSIGDGEFTVLVGPSGCGKTTALRTVAGLEEATAGQILIDGKVVNHLTPKERDIAMVFQNYALYPHMSVADNMSFALEIQKLSKDEIKRRVAKAADILGLQDYLGRRPRELSGGQRQRVAMGRAIVREPKAFLMDEPLSNLDAKLRVQMRSEIRKLQRELAVTTLYVTHDQTEAMTMGDRVAVIRSGVLQQFDSPQRLYESPVNQFVAGFIGSPPMNMVKATVRRTGNDLFVAFGAHLLHVDPAVVQARPALAGYDGKSVVLGIRPEHFEDANIVPGTPLDRRLRVVCDLRESTGADLLVHFTVDAPIALTDDARALAAEEGKEAHELEAQAKEATTTLVARLSPESGAAEGSNIELAVDTSKLHFFDATTGLAIGDGVVPLTPETPNGEVVH